MKAVTPLLLTAVGLSSSAGASLSERDLATINSVITQINTDLSALDTAVEAFSSDGTQVTSASSTLLSDLMSGTTTVSNTEAITLQEAIGLQQSTAALQTTSTSLMSNLEMKKSAFEQANLCDTVRDQVSELSTQSQNLINAVVSKVPEAAQQVASQLVSEFTATLQQSEASFSTGNCSNANGVSSGNGTTSASPETTSALEANAAGVAGWSVGALAVAAFAFAL
ncbi:hypothetical protein MKZ38_005905 [Zalerion maritima]|uniref:Cell wall protein n=1 Tax=Zalerion maritima TaxID=339359 RepID=A0AAD5RKF5_9PEZI|nr:hypothetical protein MKZ38_005905 [Zalerion maritima]